MIEFIGAILGLGSILLAVAHDTTGKELRLDIWFMWGLLTGVISTSLIWFGVTN